MLRLRSSRIAFTTAWSRRRGGIAALIVDGYADLDPDGRPGPGAPACAALAVPVIGVAKSAFRTATRAIPVLRRSSAGPLYVTAAGMPRADAAGLVRHVAGRYRLPDALRRADTLARHGLPEPAQPGTRPAITAIIAAEADATTMV